MLRASALVLYFVAIFLANPSAVGLGFAVNTGAAIHFQFVFLGVANVALVTILTIKLAGIFM